ncbi:MAG: SDR family NAD(P)-dependent oxidoreductase [Pseudonocardia sp.]
MGTLDGKVAIVTGAGGGIGSATALLLARHGAAVALLDVRADTAAAVAQQVTQDGGVARALAVDVADEPAVSAAVDEVVAALGGVDVLVNNAGIALGRPLLETSVDEWERVQAVNLRGTFLMTKHVVPHLRVPGAIVNIASVAALMAVPSAAAYSAAKGGVVALTRVAAAELGPDVRVNCICPGTVRTTMPDELLRRRGGGDVEAGAALTAQRYLLGRLGEPGEIASAVLFLAGPDSSFFTGAVLVADGGVTAQ